MHASFSSSTLFYRHFIAGYEDLQLQGADEISGNKIHQYYWVEMYCAIECNMPIHVQYDPTMWCTLISYQTYCICAKTYGSAYEHNRHMDLDHHCRLDQILSSCMLSTAERKRCLPARVKVRHVMTKNGSDHRSVTNCEKIRCIWRTKKTNQKWPSVWFCSVSLCSIDIESSEQATH